MHRDTSKGRHWSQLISFRLGASAQASYPQIALKFRYQRNDGTCRDKLSRILVSPHRAQDGDGPCLAVTAHYCLVKVVTRVAKKFQARKNGGEVGSKFTVRANMRQNEPRMSLLFAAVRSTKLRIVLTGQGSTARLLHSFFTYRPNA